MSAAFVLAAMTAPRLCRSTGLSIRGCSCDACRARLLGAAPQPPSDGPLWTVEAYAAQFGISREELVKLAASLEIPK